MSRLLIKLSEKSWSQTLEGHLKLIKLSCAEDGGIFSVKVKFEDTKRNAGGEGGYLGTTDAESRRHRYRTGFGTLVVYADNDER